MLTQSLNFVAWDIFESLTFICCILNSDKNKYFQSNKSRYGGRGSPRLVSLRRLAYRYESFSTNFLLIVKVSANFKIYIDALIEVTF